MNQYSTSRINKEGVGQLAETKIDNFAEKRVDLHVSTSYSLNCPIDKYGQALRNYQSYSIDQVNIRVY